MNKQQNSRLFVLLACLAFSFLYCPPIDIFYDDKSIFKYFGYVLSRGGTPYQSFFDHKPPLIFFLNYLGGLLGPWGLWIIDTALVAFASLFFYDTCRRHRLPLPWLLPLLFNLLLRDYRICLGIGMTREYTAIIQLIFFCIFLSENRLKYAWFGFLAGLTFFMQQEQILLLLPFFAYDAWAGNIRRLPRKILEITAGFLLVTAPILIWFAARHALSDLWKDAFLFNFNWYTAEKAGFVEHFRILRAGLENTGLLMVFLTAVVLGAAVFFLNNRKKAVVFTAFIALIFSLSQEFLSGKLRDLANFAYYLTPLAASITILVFTALAFTTDDFFRNRTNQLIYGALLCINISYDMLQHTTHLSRGNEAFIDENPAWPWLQKHPPGDYQLYVLGDARFIELYNRFKILCPSPWVYQHFWNFYPNWDRDQQQLHAIQNDLVRHRTTYVLDVTPQNYFRNPEDYQAWLSFLAANYQPVPIEYPSKTILWKIKDVPQ